MNKLHNWIIDKNNQRTSHNTLFIMDPCLMDGFPVLVGIDFLTDFP